MTAPTFEDMMTREKFIFNVERTMESLMDGRGWYHTGRALDYERGKALIPYAPGTDEYDVALQVVARYVGW